MDMKSSLEPMKHAMLTAFAALTGCNGAVKTHIPFKAQSTACTCMYLCVLKKKSGLGLGFMCGRFVPCVSHAIDARCRLPNLPVISRARCCAPPDWSTYHAASHGYCVCMCVCGSLHLMLNILGMTAAIVVISSMTHNGSQVLGFRLEPW